MTFHVRLIRDIPLRKGPLLAQCRPLPGKSPVRSPAIHQTPPASAIPPKIVMIIICIDVIHSMRACHVIFLMAEGKTLRVENHR